MLQLIWTVWLSTFVLTSIATHISVVTVPLEDSILPLASLLRLLLAHGFETSLVIQEDALGSWSSLVQGTNVTSLKTSLNYSIPKPTIPFSGDPNANLASRYSRGKQFYSLLGSYHQDHVDLYLEMFPVLFEKWSQHPPDFAVIDRYAFGGIHAARELGVPFAINNPTLLLDIDGPPSYVPAPLSGLVLSRQTVWIRLLSFHQRLLYRITMTQLLHQLEQAWLTSHVKTPHPFDSKMFQTGDVLVMTNTVFGIEDSRPISPLTFLSGPLRPDFSVGQSDLSAQLAPVLAWMDTFPEGTVFVLAFLDDRTGAAEGILRRLAEAVDSLQPGAALVARRPPTLPSAAWAHLLPELEMNGGGSRSVPYPGDGLGTAAALRLLEGDRVVAVVTSGQPAFTQSVLAAGKPVVLVPSAPDSHELAARLVNMYAGQALDPEHFSKAEMAQALQRARGLSNKTAAPNQVGREDELLAWGTRRATLLLQQAPGVEGAVRAVEAAVEMATGQSSIDPGLQQYYASALSPALCVQGAGLRWWEEAHLDVCLLLAAILCVGVVLLRACWGCLWALCGLDDFLYDDTATSLSHHSKPSSAATADLGGTNHHIHDRSVSTASFLGSGKVGLAGGHFFSPSAGGVAMQGDVSTELVLDS